MMEMEGYQNRTIAESPQAFQESKLSVMCDDSTHGA
jgi:hypothetical protein